MRKFSPGASIHSDYYYICDYCEIDDGRPLIIWDKLPKRKGHFAICYECLTKLNNENDGPENEIDPKIIITRLIIPENTRNKIFDRDNNQCVFCGSQENLSLDHIIPFSRGGRTIEENLQTVCKPCNSKKGSKRTFQYGKV